MVTHILSQFLKTLVPTSALFVLMLSLTSLHAAVPGLINYQGRLTDSNGDPVTGSKTFAVAIYDAAAGGNQLYSENMESVTLDSNGVYSFKFGSAGDGIGAALVGAGEHWLELSVDGVKQTPRDRVLAVPFAQVAETANSAETANTANTVADGAITSTKLAPGVAAENLAASGQSTVPSGSMLFSLNRDDPVFTNQGYVMLGNTIRTKTAGDPNAPAFSESGSTIAVWTGSKVIVWGQIRQDDEYSYGGGTPGGACYDPATKRWSRISAEGGPGLSQSDSSNNYYRAIWTGSKMIIEGEVDYYDGDNQTQIDTWKIFIYDPATDSWSTAPEGAPTRTFDDVTRQRPLWTGSKLIYWYRKYVEDEIAQSSTSSLEGKVYDAETNSWSEMAVKSLGVKDWNDSNSYEGHTVTATWAGDKMIVIRPRGVVVGQDTYGNPVFDIKLVTYAYDPVANSWSDLADSPVSDRLQSMYSDDEGETDARTIWTGSKLIVWGLIQDGEYGDPLDWVGYAYDVAANSWAAISLQGAPSFEPDEAPARGIDVVRTGAKLMVGNMVRNAVESSDEDGYFWIGYAYDPAADSWAALPTDAPPLKSGRGHVFWIGGKLIVTPNFDYSYSPLRSGVVYDPENISWSSTPTWGDLNNPIHLSIGSKLFLLGRDDGNAVGGNAVGGASMIPMPRMNTPGAR